MHHSPIGGLRLFETEEVENLRHLRELILEDARTEPDAYLAQCLVPGGGE